MLFLLVGACKLRVGKCGALPAAGAFQSTMVLWTPLSAMLRPVLPARSPRRSPAPHAYARHRGFLHPADCPSPTYRCRSLLKANSQGFPRAPAEEGTRGRCSSSRRNTGTRGRRHTRSPAPAPYSPYRRP